MESGLGFRLRFGFGFGFGLGLGSGFGLGFGYGSRVGGTRLEQALHCLELVARLHVLLTREVVVALTLAALGHLARGRGRGRGSC